MRILFCIKSLSVQGGGAERVIVDVATGLAARGHIVFLVTFDKPESTFFYQPGEGVLCYRLGVGDVSMPASMRETFARILALRRFILDHDMDCAVGFMHSIFILLALASRGTGVPIIASEHIVPAHYRSRYLERILLHVTSIFVSQYTAVSEQVRDLYPHSIRKKMRVVPNPVVLPASRRADVRATTSSSKTLLAVGRLEDQKDHITLIDAFAKLAPAHQTWRLKIVGEGTLRAALERRVELYGLQDRIFLPGATTQISEEYSQAQLFVIPSRYESLGLAVLEAMSHGLPAIGFADCSGVNVLIRHCENGLLVAPEPSRIEGLQAALGLVMGDVDMRVKLAERAVGLSDQNSLECSLNAWEATIDKTLHS